MRHRSSFHGHSMVLTSLHPSHHICVLLARIESRFTLRLNNSCLLAQCSCRTPSIHTSSRTLPASSLSKLMLIYSVFSMKPPFLTPYIHSFIFTIFTKPLFCQLILRLFLPLCYFFSCTTLLVTGVWAKATGNMKSLASLVSP